MHYGSFLFLALLCIFQPIISKGNIVDGREYHCERSLRSLLSDKRSYVRQDHRFAKVSPEVLLIRDDRLSRSSSRYRERIDSSRLQRNYRAIRQFRSNDNRPERRFTRNSERLVPDRQASQERNLDDVRKVREERNTLLSRTRQVHTSTERVETRNAIEAQFSRTRNTERLRSRSVEIRIARHRSSEEKPNVNMERLPRYANYERRESTQRINDLPNRSWSQGREHTRVPEIRNAENQVRRDLHFSTRERHYTEKRTPITEVLETRWRKSENHRRESHEVRQSRNGESRNERTTNSQKRERFIAMNREAVLDRKIATRSIKRSQTTSSIRRNNVHERNINLLRERKEFERQGAQHREPRSDARRETRGYAVEVRDMERDIAGRRHVRNNRAQGHIRVNYNLIEHNISEMRKNSNFRDNDVRDVETDRISRLELMRKSPIFLREPQRTSAGYERRNMLRETNEHVSRFDTSRNILNSFKNDEKYLIKNWQILFYTLQGIYLCSILFKVLNKNEYSVKKTRSFVWFPISDTMKID